MSTATITVDREFIVGPVPRRLFGSFVEHMGRCVYTGIYEPGHPNADEHGFRRDVLDLTREMGVSIVRYPGGNFVSGYRWEDGVGPVEQRPRRLDGAWHTVETNAFGLHEFAAWAKDAGVEVMEAINLGTRGVEEARAIVEYANHPGGTEWSDKRRANGAEEPFDIRVWNLGNELDGPWQIGHKTADEYGRLAQEAGKAMKLVDPTIELVAVGSSNSHMPTFGSWEYTVLSHAYDEVDYISMHAYYQEHDGDALSFLASANDMDYFIESVVATADAVKAKRQSSKVVNVSFDEWNVWYQRGLETEDQPHVVGKAQWREHPRLIEDQYNVTDAVVVGTFLNSLLRHGDRVTIANQAQLVNVIAPIRSEENGPAWRQTIYWPFARTAELARGDILRTVVRSDRFASSQYGDADVVDASVTYDADRGRVAVFVANRGLEEASDVTVALRGFTAGQVTRAEVLTIPEGGDRFTANTEAAQDAVGLTPLQASVQDGALRTTLPPLSWAVLEVEVTQA
ncbi:MULTISPECIES: alpha-N-arabinofuranosidase [unclassified Curtobacterium]|uniref:arabinosylfuranosidase ArfA n=1 Tax=unclassified Curtobacterium TaxID=257496 RepID=UPI000DA79582|nr:MULTISPECIES: alpha-N-arabinofuranosidase [unclassified Curtobacterium]PZE24779.1 alpha-L-arabinofuranosidase [Curtobacterium sp. MCBD17_028]PZE73838.1 alpha-L-arabinofuranosidase [Curtobacterium sp. MCBD17_019]